MRGVPEACEVPARRGSGLKTREGAEHDHDHLILGGGLVLRESVCPETLPRGLALGGRVMSDPAFHSAYVEPALPTGWYETYGTGYLQLGFKSHDQRRQDEGDCVARQAGRTGGQRA